MLQRGPDLRREENAGNQKANTTIGIPGTFSARLQPNDTRDDVQSIAAQIYEGLSFGVGDAVIGVNPVTDDVENLSRVLDTIYGVIDKFNIPTQGCVLAHVTTQIEAIRRGAPGGLIFQSICGSEKGLKEFGVELAMLDEARAVGAEFNRIAGKTASTSKPDKALRYPLALTSALTR